MAVAGARGRGFGAPARVGGGALQRLALVRLAILQIEPHALHRVGAAGHRDVDHLTDARDVVEPHLDQIARDVAPRDLPPVHPVAFELQVVGNRADGILRETGGGELLLHGGHRGRILRLRLLRILRSALGRQRHPRLIGRDLDEPFARHHDDRLGPRAVCAPALAGHTPNSPTQRDDADDMTAS